MKNILLTLGALLTFNLTFGQDYDDLRIMFVDEKYEKLLKTAEQYTMKDKSKDDAEPYLWLARALFAMSKNEEYTNQDKYKKALNDSFTWLSKYYKKDKNLDLYNDHRDFFVEIKTVLYEMIETDLSSGNYAKALGNISKISKVSPNNMAQDYLSGACNFLKGDKTGARDNWKKADDLLKTLTDDIVNNWEKPDKLMLALGMVETAKCYVKSKKPDLAKDLMKKGMTWFEDFDFYTDYFKEL
jgi:tetratricopeptide (TPR) repeat protein